MDELAYAMRLLLGRIHFMATKDGHDIEFVVGGDEINNLSKEEVFCIEFKEMYDRYEVVVNIVESFLMNKPYYLCPRMSYCYEFTRDH